MKGLFRAQRLNTRCSHGDHGWVLATIPSGQVSFGGRTGPGIYYSSGDSVTDVTGKWHHVVGMRNGSNWRIYVDGVLENSATGGTGTLATPWTLQIGHESGSVYWFPGTIDDVRIYNRALSAAEVKQLYNAGR
jgi:hypothetical protein